MKLAEITSFLESLAPLNYQEDYDNSGLLIGNANDEVSARPWWR
jgi:putative NIF3 family GTP cyclohydrolase 1 type 2